MLLKYYNIHLKFWVMKVSITLQIDNVKLQYMLTTII